jgi:hypothetical protein
MLDKSSLESKFSSSSPTMALEMNHITSYIFNTGNCLV